MERMRRHLNLAQQAPGDGGNGIEAAVAKSELLVSPIILGRRRSNESPASLQRKIQTRCRH